MIKQMVGLAISQDSERAILESLCVLANKFGDETWIALLNGMAEDAEALLAKIDKRKQRERDGGASEQEVDELVRAVKLSAKPSRALRDELAKSLGEYRMRTTLKFDAAACKVMRTPLHPASAPTETMVAFALCLAIRDGHWQSFRRCREPKCRIFFYDHKTRGGRPQLYCCKRHRENHTKRIARGSE